LAALTTSTAPDCGACHFTSVSSPRNKKQREKYEECCRTTCCCPQVASTIADNILTYLLAISGFHHIIAGSTTMVFSDRHEVHLAEQVCAAIFSSDLTRQCHRGVSLVAALGHARVVGGKEP